MARQAAVLDEGFGLLIYSDGSNLAADYLWMLPRSHDFVFDRTAHTICGVTAAAAVNEFLISSAELPPSFEVRFEVTLPDGLNSGLQLRSAMLDSGLAKLHGPQVEIANDGFGAIYSEATRKGWLLPPSERTNVAAAHWDSVGWNRYRVVVEGTSWRVWVNGALVSELDHTFDAAFWAPLDGAVAVNRLGFQVHSPYSVDQVGQRVCWRHVLLKAL